MRMLDDIEQIESPYLIRSDFICAVEKSEHKLYSESESQILDLSCAVVLIGKKGYQPSL